MPARDDDAARQSRGRAGADRSQRVRERPAIDAERNQRAASLPALCRAAGRPLREWKVLDLSFTPHDFPVLDSVVIRRVSLTRTRGSIRLSPRDDGVAVFHSSLIDR